MSKRAYIEIDKNDLPEIFEIELAGQNVYLKFDFNNVGQFYTVDLFDNSMEPIVIGEKLSYGRRLWNGINNPNIPNIDVMPFDESMKEKTITPENLGVTVFLYLMTLEEDGEYL